MNNFVLAYVNLVVLGQKQFLRDFKFSSDSIYVVNVLRSFQTGLVYSINDFE